MLEEDAVKVLAMMFDHAVFFVMMAKWKKTLLAQGSKVYGTPIFGSNQWKPSLIKSGVLERAYMDYLLSHDDFIGAIKKWTGASYHALPEISRSQLSSRLSLATLSSVDQISKLLALDHKPHAFIVGQLNHWIAIVSNRIPANVSTQTLPATLSPFSGPSDPSSAPSTMIETLLLDSRNDFVLNMTPADIGRRVTKRVEMEFVPTPGSLWHQMCIRLYEQSLNDTQYSCDMIHQLTIQSPPPQPSRPESAPISLDDDISTTKSGKKSKTRSSSKKASDAVQVVTTPTTPHPITTDLIMLCVHGFFESYSKHVGDPFDVNTVVKTEKEVVAATNIGEWTMLFTLWIQEYSPVRAIEDNFVQSIRNAKKSGYVIPEYVARALSAWIVHLKARFAQVLANSIEVDGFNTIVSDMNDSLFPFIAKTCKYLLRN